MLSTNDQCFDGCDQQPASSSLFHHILQLDLQRFSTDIDFIEGEAEGDQQEYQAESEDTEGPQVVLKVKE